MIYPFKEIKAIRKIRKSASAHRLTAEKAVFAEASQKLERSKQELFDFKENRRRKEHTLYCSIAEQSLSFYEFMHFQHQIGYFNELEQIKADVLDKARQEQNAAGSRVEKAAADFALRNKESVGIEEHHTSWREIVDKELDRRLEDELDELSQNFLQHREKNRCG